VTQRTRLRDGPAPLGEAVGTRRARNSTSGGQRSPTGQLPPCVPITSASVAGDGATYFLPVSDGSSSPLAAAGVAAAREGSAEYLTRDSQVVPVEDSAVSFFML
jgi:hypothetical protein